MNALKCEWVSYVYQGLKKTMSKWRLLSRMPTVTTVLNRMPRKRYQRSFLRLPVAMQQETSSLFIDLVRHSKDVRTLSFSKRDYIHLHPSPISLPHITPSPLSLPHLHPSPDTPSPSLTPYRSFTYQSSHLLHLPPQPSPSLTFILTP